MLVNMTSNILFVECSVGTLVALKEYVVDLIFMSLYLAMQKRKRILIIMAKYIYV